jgi:hypothetical protein
LCVSLLAPLLEFPNQWVGIGVKLALVALFIPALFVLRVMSPAQARRLLPA